MSVEIQFLGDTGTVTGSKYLNTFKGKKILIDCGLFQELKKLRLQNWNECHSNSCTHRSFRVYS